jgi:hypothetical protein
MATTGSQYLQKRSNISLRCTQINLKRSKTATVNIHQLIRETTIHITFIKEPYNYHNQVTGIPRNYKVFTSGKGRKRATILIDHLSHEDRAVIEITYGNLKFIATGNYLHSKNEITEDLHKIENIQRLAKGRGLLLAMDSNTSSKTWHDVTSNKRGRNF